MKTTASQPHHQWQCEALDVIVVDVDSQAEDVFSGVTNHAFLSGNSLESGLGQKSNTCLTANSPKHTPKSIPKLGATISRAAPRGQLLTQVEIRSHRIWFLPESLGTSRLHVEALQ